MLGLTRAMNEGETAAGLAPTPGYRYAERVGPQLFVAGQVPLNAQARVIGIGDPAAQATQCLENLRILLTHHQFQLSDIRRLVVYVVAGPQPLELAWRAVRAWFNDDVPPATLLGVAQLGYAEQLVEIDATVVRAT